MSQQATANAVDWSHKADRRQDRYTRSFLRSLSDKGLPPTSRRDFLHRNRDHPFAGDLLSTGTPAGCALSVPSPFKQRMGALLPEATKWAIFNKVQEGRQEYLQVGDVVEARIQSPDGVIDLGVQRNKVVRGT